MCEDKNTNSNINININYTNICQIFTKNIHEKIHDAIRTRNDTIRLKYWEYEKAFLKTGPFVKSGDTFCSASEAVVGW